MTTAFDVTIEDLNNKEFVTDYVRGLVFPEFELAEFFPELRFEGIEWEWDKTNSYQEPAISYRAWDAPVSIGKRPGVAKASQEMLPLGKKKILTEEHKIREQAIERNNWGGLVRTSLNDLEDLTQGVHSRWELDRAQLMSTGILTLRGPHNGVDYEFSIDIDYSVPTDNKPTASPLWSSLSTADPISDLLAWQKIWRNANKKLRPGVILLSETVLGYLLRNDAIRASLYFGGANTAPSVMTEQLIRNEFQAQGLPPFRVIDEQLTDQLGNYVDALPQNKIIMLPSAATPLGHTVHGRTAEALGMIEQGIIQFEDGAGIVGSSWDSDGDPPQRFNKVSAVGFPVITDPNRVLIGTVA